MSDLLVVLFIVGGLAFIAACIVVPIVASDHEWSLALWRAARARRKAVEEKAVYYVSLGFHKNVAWQKAENAVSDEAKAAEKDVEA